MLRRRSLRFYWDVLVDDVLVAKIAFWLVEGGATIVSSLVWKDGWSCHALIVSEA